MAFGWCLPLARRVNIQTPAVRLSHRAAHNKGRRLPVCTGRPLAMPKMGAWGSVHLYPLSTFALCAYMIGYCVRDDLVCVGERIIKDILQQQQHT